MQDPVVGTAWCGLDGITKCQHLGSDTRVRGATGIDPPCLNSHCEELWLRDNNCILLESQYLLEFYRRLTCGRVTFCASCRIPNPNARSRAGPVQHNTWVEPKIQLFELGSGELVVTHTTCSEPFLVEVSDIGELHRRAGVQQGCPDPTASTTLLLMTPSQTEHPVTKTGRSRKACPASCQTPSTRGCFDRRKTRVGCGEYSIWRPM